ncbi:dynactin-associated protein-like [Pteropus medius]|uniref:dynactin-associated protein-like n=1 Tax=Pteropus vampyrus TaxID=132908 RepID=UPI00196A2A05|nr:dynactin-associated protein-like [Pteropus giganteus]
MDRKHGKYIVNVEHSENQPPITCSNDQEAHSPARWHLPSNDIIDDVPSNLTGVCVSPGVLAHSGYPHTELSHTQVKGNGCCNWSLWNVFLACLLACVITTAIGVLVICLVNNRGNNNSTIVINLPSKDREPVIIVHETTTASPPTVTITSAEPATTANATSTGPPTTGPPSTAITGISSMNLRFLGYDPVFLGQTLACAAGLTASACSHDHLLWIAAGSHCFSGLTALGLIICLSPAQRCQGLLGD